MPTGYTFPVADGEITELKDFALSCARAMGALVTMRDDPSDAPIPERLEPHLDYYAPALGRAKQKLAEHMAMHFGEYDEAIEKEYQEALASHNEYARAEDLRNARILAMLHKVRRWNTKAEGIKEFMINQLEISIDDYERKPPVKPEPAKWALDKKDKLERDIKYLEKQISEEINRTRLRNEWLDNLRESLK